MPFCFIPPRTAAAAIVRSLPFWVRYSGIMVELINLRSLAFVNASLNSHTVYTATLPRAHNTHTSPVPTVTLSPPPPSPAHTNPTHALRPVIPRLFPSSYRSLNPAPP